MARRGQKKHLKRLPAPRHWPIKRKEAKFTTRVIPGPHPKEHSLNLALILREILGYAENMREVKAILSTGQIKVDGVVRKNPRFPVGLMDVIEIIDSNERFRLLPKLNGGLRLVSVNEDEAGFKLCRIENKSLVKGGKVQLGLHDGRTILVEPEKAADYSTLDTLKMGIPKQKLMKSINLDKGVYAIVTRGKNIGIEGKVLEISKRIGTHASTVTIQDPEGNRFETALDYVFAVGKTKSEVTLDGGGSE
ncbi:MAG: 30S ribosomal protein S4e [Candidatus Thorarchaeota archaeon]